MEYICNLCPRNCNAVRTEKENIGGVCKMPYSIFVARAQPHFWEEPCISGTNGSGTVFFSGCSLGCVFCQNAKISHNRFGIEITPKKLAEIFKQLEQNSVHNINLVSPTHYVPQIIEALNIYKPKIPIVYNSSGYEKKETLNLLKNYVDIFLLDFKYSSSERSSKYSKAENYKDYALSALKTCYGMVGAKVIKNGIMQKGVIVRHLLLPGGTNDAIKIIKLIDSLNYDIYFSLMSQYTVMPFTEYKELSRSITKREYSKVTDYLLTTKLDGFLQDFSSKSEKYIPSFNGEGINL